ncbi:MAG: hypothetical protein ACOH2S_04690 [Janthinobacterium svalbardensis]|uniref:hypothetical protein n=1 Tax=Janthinobacterium svalbardensis TaxID=368607 RepID=UPI00142DAE64|nr:hypothetical protein [Janthinobacterium svalbardensis]
MLQHVRRLLQAGCHHVVALVLAFLAFKVDGVGQPRFPAPGQKVLFVQRPHPCPLLIMVAAMQLHWCSGFFAIIVAHKLIFPRVGIQFFIQKLLAAPLGEWAIVHLVWLPS